jgi:hypothetical protein
MPTILFLVFIRYLSIEDEEPEIMESDENSVVHHKSSE